MSTMFYIGAVMSFQEKSTWIMAIVITGAYVAYLSLVLGRAENTPLTEVPYISTLLWTILSVIVASIAVHIVDAIASPKDAGQEDIRDRQIDRLGEYARRHTRRGPIRRTIGG